jgi:hypothetical protein
MVNFTGPQVGNIFSNSSNVIAQSSWAAVTHPWPPTHRRAAGASPQALPATRAGGVPRLPEIPPPAYLLLT